MATIVPTKDAIPDEAYRKMVLTLMDKQAGREVATAEVFGQCVLHAPTVEDKIRITRFQGEELKHFQLIAKLMRELGVDTDAYVRDRQKAGARFTGDEADMQIQDWIDATLFNFMIDRAATFQLTEYTRGSYVPLARPDVAAVHGTGLDGQPVTFSGDGLLARCLQHETDHTRGTVFGDRLSTRWRKKLLKAHEKVADRYAADWPVTPSTD